MAMTCSRSTVIKIASMIDEHTRLSLMHLVERSITAERLVTELEAVFATAGGPPKVLRMDNGPELVSQALQRFCDGKVGVSYIPPGSSWDNGYIESFNNRLRKEVLDGIVKPHLHGFQGGAGGRGCPTIFDSLGVVIRPLPRSSPSDPRTRLINDAARQHVEVEQVGLRRGQVVNSGDKAQAGSVRHSRDCWPCRHQTAASRAVPGSRSGHRSAQRCGLMPGAISSHLPPTASSLTSSASLTRRSSTLLPTSLRDTPGRAV